MADITSSIASKSDYLTQSAPDHKAPFEGPKKSKVMSIFLSFFGIPDLKLSSVLFTVF